MSSKNATECLLADDAGIARAVKILESGGLVAVPTETVYGLAARADSPEAVAKIYGAKGRPDFNPLIAHVRDGSHAGQLAYLIGKSELLIEEFWPGPLTLVLPAKENTGLAPAVTAGLPTLALRAPAHPLMRRILEQADFPIAAPSANQSGSISPSCAEHVLQSLDGRIDAVVDGGVSPQGLESTIIAFRESLSSSSWELLRPGPITEEQLADILGPASPTQTYSIEAPGQIASHYSPGKPVRLNAQRPDSDEFLIGFGEIEGDCTLSQKGDLNDAAAHLYICLHQARASEFPKIAVAPIPNQGVGIAINDRLKRAAA